MNSKSEKPLTEYTQEQLSQYADSIYERHIACSNNEIKEILQKKWSQIATLYNTRAHVDAYSLTL